ncbi:unnamed protein product [Coregonus sp. 'balchen']|nr:unnamed protein product [Coregonus sp. 'balchen']
MLSPSSCLLQKRREATEVHKAMKLQGDFESTLRAMRIRKDELIEGGQMKEYLQKFDNFLKTTQQNQDSTEKARAQLARFMEQSNDTLLHYNNTLAQLQWAHIQDTAAKTTLLLGTIKMATLNLYQSVCKRAKDTRELPVAPEDTPKQQEKVP